MDKKILNHYRQYGLFTYPGLYEDHLKKLPDDIRKTGSLIRRNFIHRTTLDAGNTGTNADLKYGDMTKVPWWDNLRMMSYRLPWQCSQNCIIVILAD